MLQTRVRRDFSQPYFRLDADLNGAEMAAALAHMRDNGLDVLSEEGVKPEQRSVSHSVDIRYEAQEYTLTVPLNGADEPKDENFLATVAERFADMHQGRYGHANRGAPIEFVTLRAAAFGDFEQPPPQTWPAAATADFPHEIRKVVFGGEPVDSLLVRRDDLGAGHTFAGPAVIVEDTATTVVPPDYDVTVDEIGSLLIRVRTAATEEIAS